MAEPFGGFKPAVPTPADTTSGNNADIVGKYADRVASQVWQRAGFFDRPQTIQEQLEQQRRGGSDAINNNPGAKPAPYDKVPHDADKHVMRSMLRHVSPAATGLYEMYLRTYTDRSGENKTPDRFQIAELHKGVKERVSSMELYGDSDMMVPKAGGRHMHPDGRKRPGDFYAVLKDAGGDPVNVLEYTQGKDGPKFLQQWIFDSQINEQQGLQRTTISHFVNQNQPAFRPREQQGVVADVFAGKTEYVYSKDGKMLIAAKYNALQQPEVVVDFRTPTPTMRLRDTNTGQLKDAPFNVQQLGKLAFKNLYLGV